MMIRKSVIGLVAVFASYVAAMAVCEAGQREIYSHLLDPREHPDYERRAVRPPSWDDFRNRTQMSAMRFVPIKENTIVDYAEVLDKYTKTYGLGDVFTPSYQLLFTKNLGDLVDELQRRGLYLGGFWGYVPGSSPVQFEAPADTLKMLEAKLGPRWLGMDVGEQDGRYLGCYAMQMCPASAGRFEQYLNFQRFFQRMADDLGNKVSALISLNFGHYFLKEGIYTLIGAETAQGLPNSQVYYAFIRGACKQYGVLWYGNVSIYNRWGCKLYGSDIRGDGDPTRGTSLSLMKRLIYNHILYNSAHVGMEWSFFDGEKLSPIGRIQQAAGEWMEDNGQPGVMLTPVAVMTDFFAGWTFPRHLYSQNTYRVWGNLPYEPGDFLTDGVFDLLYPGYRDASYYFDETGFLTPTPYGDSADCLLSDAPGWLLARYPLLVVGGELSGGAEIRDKLATYVHNGGHLIVSAGNVAKMPGGLAGVRVSGRALPFSAKQHVDIEPSPLCEDNAFELLPLEFPANSKVLARCGETPAVVELSHGKGTITVLAAPFGVGAEPAESGKIAKSPDRTPQSLSHLWNNQQYICGPIPDTIERPLPKPFPLLKHVAAVLERAFHRHVMFEAGRDLQVVTCRKSQGVYTVGIFNNMLKPLPFSIVSHCGTIESVRELPIDGSERGEIGHLPSGIDVATIGTNGPKTIAGGDVRIFEVRLQEELVREIPHVVPPARPRGRVLPLRKLCSIKEEILARPTFFGHYDSVLIDWRYLHERRIESVEKESAWLARQGLRVIVDLSSGINLYPDIRLVENHAEEYATGMKKIDDVLERMTAIGARDLVIAGHCPPELGFNREQTDTSTDKTVGDICRRAEKRGITVYLRVLPLGSPDNYPGKPPTNFAEAIEMIGRIDAKNLRLAPSTACFAGAKPMSDKLAAEAGKKIGLWMAGGPAYDFDGRLWNIHKPVAGMDNPRQLLRLLNIAPHASLVFDVLYDDQDAEYLDVSFIERLLPTSKQ